MSKENNGGPAYPTQGYEGLTLRDYFAAQAMQGMLANPGMWDLINEKHAQSVAIDAFQVADAMLIAREEV